MFTSRLYPGLLVYWSTGLLVYWSTGLPVYRSTGLPVSGLPAHLQFTFVIY
ncbi:MAG: hypothetical protein GY759_15575 [Chloroflexi bacterium]|nr:hypothetical protein [Chloroflexota bacterium]